MKYIANIITVSRIFLSLILFFMFRYPQIFIILYIICGASDLLDGYIARKTNTQTELGAKLDSIADLFFFAVIMVSIILWMGIDFIRFIPFIILILIIRLINIGIGIFKYHTFVILHTWGNKLTGLFVFFIPIISFTHQSVIFWLICIAVLSALEETLIHLSSKQLNRDRKSLFLIDK
ncbi:CDP-alcohol phosphatidyltransferase family protein [Anaerocolumna sp. MB42-C2]|uniref:CDP-alcohol phosphatidyltransferase family protein n=1 Tax=Anaerocolumna sp. MB42-C2 TaxID=3070997 RepID=UPI0027DFA68E|nr:CDP-alcohol phosphatidyltransferase family protein [Anaerocolumna sp. MB42-C2]WMJ88379.1 CDP-alcohol phosphatidyltransferase family protein [Anaerocolumna sp. MB42-C2]